MGHHTDYETESAARTDNATVGTVLSSSFPLPQRSASVECPCISKSFIAGSITRAAGIKAHKRTCAVTRSSPNQIVDHFLLSHHVLRKRLTVEMPQQSLCLLRLYVVMRPFTSSLSLLYSCASLSWYCRTNQRRKIKVSRPYLLVTRVRRECR